MNEGNIRALKFTVCLIVIACIVSLVCNRDNGKNKEELGIDASDLANGIQYIVNLRYNPSDLDRDRLLAICNDDVANKIENLVSNIVVDRFISLEPQFYALAENGEATGKLDGKIEERNGVRGVYIDDVHVEDGVFETMINGQYIDVEVPDSVIMGEMVGDLEQYMVVNQYNLYDDGSFKVELRTDMTTAFNNDIMPKIKIVDDEIELEGDAGSLLEDIKSLPDGEQYELSGTLLEDFKEQLIEYGDIYRLVIKGKVNNGKISNMNIEDLKGKSEIIIYGSEE